MGAAQTVFLAGTTQLLVQPPWTPAVLWDRVTLTCRGSGTDGDTRWYKDERLWLPERRNNFTVTESGTYRCHRPGSGYSPLVRVSNDSLVLQVPAGALLEGDTVTLRCRSWRDLPLNSVSFYRDGEQLATLQNGTELSLSHLQLQHSGNFSCSGWAIFQPFRSAAVPVTVQELFTVPLLEGPPRAPRGVPPQSQLPQHPQPPAAPSPPPVPLLPGRAVGGGPAGVPAAPGARRGGLPLGELQLRGALRGGNRAEEQRPARRHGAHARGRWTPLELSGCGGRCVPAVPGPARCGLALADPRGCQEAPGKGPPRAGPSGHLHGAAGAAWAALGTR
ncbi:Fc receptor-like B [Oenanthe melanoleuca]|uniref:Fc receptor-like B n=1 Tax=Oenanthe melanoleuca TaxID=2939378 RepID=UPI0024C1D6BA|nr:Fc receptor-like B [Oenanthe melanoleuca]